MAIISSIGRRQFGTKLLIWSIYALLTIGGATMIYPFLLMLSGSTKSAVDTPDARVIPRYLIDDESLYRKHMEGFFNESVGEMQNAYGLWGITFTTLTQPANPLPTPLTAEWRSFLSDLHSRQDQDPAWFVLGYLQCLNSLNSTPFNLAKLRTEILREEGSIEAVNLKYGTSFASTSAFFVRAPNYLNRFLVYPDTAFLRRVEKFSVEQPKKWRFYISQANAFRSLLQIRYGKDIAALNQLKGTGYRTWSDIPVGPTASEFDPAFLPEAEEFLRLVVNPLFVRLAPSATPAYQKYLQLKYSSLADLNTRYGTSHRTFEEIPLPERRPASGLAKSDWIGFLEGWADPGTGELQSAPLSSIRLTAPDFAFREHLEKRFGSLDAANARLGTNFSSWGVVPMPQQQAQYEEFLAMRGWLKWQFTVRNYVDVWNYLVVNGRGLVNTIIFCALSILAALTVDPIAAYALSRFKPRATYKVLLFLMMTMAFPAMVTQIPVFLMLRDLDLLNTFWALILPGLANGYSIFLLKGFFDSLPKELYESAEMDGASELIIFWNITMALSKPILAVIALGAFTGAYAAFMFALLLCQDPKMWTLMVWLYQLQQTSGQGIIFASLIVAAIPTFAVFIACQNVIMRGIVVPVEK